ncbi:MAG: hypothetical protein ACPG7F_07595, partial [Aggregatilineales bacterium]
MMTEYFSDREGIPRSPNIEEINLQVWGGIYANIQGCVDNESFGNVFPDKCLDGRGTFGCNIDNLRAYIRSEIPTLDLPLSLDKLPSKFDILDLIELA